jgi:hypothetical protein
MNWRTHPLFTYGWLPVRVAAIIIGFSLVPLIWLVIYLQWFQVERANNTVYAYITGEGRN